MVFRITNSMISQQALANINSSTYEMYNLQKQMMTGKKFSSASENPVGASQVMKFNTQIGQLSDWSENIATSKEELKFGYDTLSGVQESIQRINELTIRLANNMNTDDTNQAIITEINARAQSIQSLANAQYKGYYIFGGTNTLNPPYDVDDSFNVTYNGTVETEMWQRNTEVNYGGEEVTVNVLGKHLFGDDTGGIFATVKELNTLITADPVDVMAINACLKPIQEAGRTVANKMAEMSSSVQRLDMLSNYNTDLSTTLKGSKGNVFEIDLVEAASSYTLLRNQMETTMQMSASMLSSSSLLNYL